ncbi:hypothetical protein KGQ25_00210 [Patescibacteria group bacterium]|nr:hypothetical protein [Patescibacteria group bacterium]
MKHVPLRFAATIIALIIVAAFVLSVPHTQDETKTPKRNDTPQSIPKVTLRDAFKKNLHTITGSIEAPNACAVVNASATVAGTASSTGSILIAVSLSTDTGVCLQLPTNISFEAAVTAPANFPLEATVNGVAASTTVL